MIRAHAVLLAGDWDRSREIDHVVADYEGRYRRRMVLRGARGSETLLDFDMARHLHDGDGVERDDGGVVRIVAAAEPLLAVRLPGPAGVARLAWHLGNRHLPAAIGSDRILIRADHVTAALVVQLGGSVDAVEAPFDPERSASVAGEAHGH